jgi:hypothetical protein
VAGIAIGGDEVSGLVMIRPMARVADDLQAYAPAQDRDHRRMGQELCLFSVTNPSLILVAIVGLATELPRALSVV